MSTTSDAALYAVLAAHAGLTGLLGTGDSFRCYPVEAPQGVTLPFLVYQPIGTDPATTHQEGNDDARLDGAHFQLTAVGATPLVCAGVLYQARLAIEASATLKGSMSDEAALPRSEDADAHGRRADFLIWNNPDA